MINSLHAADYRMPAGKRNSHLSVSPLSIAVGRRRRDFRSPRRAAPDAVLACCAIGADPASATALMLS
jgi:hypothetical protein